MTPISLFDHPPPLDNQLDTDEYRELSHVLLQVGRVWYMSEEVRLHQCRSLYKAGFDELANDIRNTTSDKSKLAENLLEIAILRIAKVLYQVSTFLHNVAVSKYSLCPSVRRSVFIFVGCGRLTFCLYLRNFFTYLMVFMINREQIYCYGIFKFESR